MMLPLQKISICKQMITFPNAKINLGLDILRRREDGYHDISTVMLPIGWTDILEIVPAAGWEDSLTVSGRKVDCPPEKNLVMKAVKALRGLYDFPKVDIFLRKVIPDGAGMGGGSSDAAFTLKTINGLFNLNLDRRRLAEIASQIGADCPFFIYNKPMLCEGTGTTMSAFALSDLSGYDLAVVKPSASVPTAMAYSRVSPALPERSVAEILTDSMPEQWQGRLKNDFEPSVFSALPEVGEIKEKLLEMGAVYCAMSGSGSAVFAFFRHDTMSAERIEPAFTECDCFFEKGVKKEF